MAAYEVIQRKGATNHAIGLVTASLLGTLLRGERRLLSEIASDRPPLVGTQCRFGFNLDDTAFVRD